MSVPPRILLLYSLGNYDGRFRIFDEYKIDEYSNFITSAKYGEWDPRAGLTVYEENIWKRRSNLKGHHIRYIIEYEIETQYICM